MKTSAVEQVEDFPGPTFKAVIFYDDISHAARVAAAMERAATSADPDMNCDLKFWRLEALHLPEQSAICMAVAADANVITLALRGAPPLLEELLEWLEDWAVNRRTADAAVTLLGPETDATVPLRVELERFARRHGLACLDANQAWNNGVWNTSSRAHPQQSPATEPAPLSIEESMQAVSHWGIND